MPEERSPFLMEHSPLRRSRRPVWVCLLVAVLVALLCGASVLTGVVFVSSAQRELARVRQELSALQTQNTALSERLTEMENVLDFIMEDGPLPKAGGHSKGAEVADRTNRDTRKVRKLPTPGLFGST
ncbi:Hypp7205 [Branchiostoma lanceolatum]|uniref:Hypp7205 protein n=1 Tax=Branchiostoma lanceolatum TaxID=7740 RepID=A0A8K0ECX0_BRALA|nr:Hypp7205 [Branchiostoma lanceolatum]